MRSRRLWKLGVGGTLVVLALSAGCGGDDGESGDAAAPAPTETGSSTDTTDTADTTDSDSGTGLGFDCPLSAEQVGEILGASVEKDEPSCSYAPGGNVGSVPAAGFIGQLAELCEGDFITENGYTEPVEGLGVDAYLRTDGAATAEIWVCADDAFLLYVDTGDSNTDAAVAAAEALALAALEAG